jgi:hypothetical protein
MRQTALLALLLVCVPWSVAQRRMAPAAHFAGPAFRARGGNFVSGWNFGAAHRRYDVYDSLLYPYGFPVDDSYLDLSGFQPTPQPIIVIQAPPGAGTNLQPPVSEPLLIELRGDRYVRLTSENTSEGLQTLPEPATSARASAARSRQSESTPGASPETTQAPPMPELKPVILIFRDGHREEIRDYAIADGVIYARGNYYADGFWNRQIALAALNLPETFNSNQARGVRFVLPASANEVVTRP